MSASSRPAAAGGELAVRRIDDLLADPARALGRGQRSSSSRTAWRSSRADPRAVPRGRRDRACTSAAARSASSPPAALGELGHYSRGLHSPKTGRKFRPATPPLFSFNSPLGACPKCRGFGRVIEIDYRLAIPDPSLSIDDGAIRCWEGAVYSESKDDLRVFTKRRKIPTDVPFAAADRGAAGLHHRRRAGLRRGERQGVAEILVRREGVLPLAGEEHLQDARARLPLALPLLQHLPRLRRHAPAARGPLLEMAGLHAARALPAAGRPSCCELVRRLAARRGATARPSSPTSRSSPACATCARWASAT